MKTLKYILSLAAVALIATTVTSCGEDEVTASLQELRNEGFDLIVVTDAAQYLPVSFAVSGSGLKNVSATVVSVNTGEEVSQGGLGSITSSNLNRVNFKIPFPTNDVAPSGVYTINYTYTVGSNERDGGSYNVNVVNNASPVFCDFTNSLPSGKTVWLRVYTPTGAQLDPSDVVYATGSFGEREGGANWDGGGPSSPFVFTKLDDTCYELALNLQSGDEFKITRGSFDEQAQDYNRSSFDNFKYEGQSTFTVRIYDWEDLNLSLEGIDPPPVTLDIPPSAVVPGMMTVVVNVSNSDVNSGNYYIIEENATSLEDGYLMTPFEEENRLAVAVPKDDMANYIMVKEEIGAVGSNIVGNRPQIIWDGETNPVQVSVGNFDGGVETIYMTGSATDGWAGGESYPIPRVSPSIYEATFNITGDGEYLLLPSPGDYGNKFGFASGTPSSGVLIGPNAGANLSTAGLATGEYTITLDFTTSEYTYTLTPTGN